jgi:competence protein ComEA
MHSVSPLNINIVLLLASCVPAAWAQLPDAVGREATQRVCSGCHELERSISLRQDRDGWKGTVTKIIGLGADASEADFFLIVDYLSANYPADAMPPLNVNTARGIDSETRFSLKRSESAAIIKYRNENGKFKSISDLKKVPGIDTSKIDAKKEALIF